MHTTLDFHLEYDEIEDMIISKAYSESSWYRRILIFQQNVRFLDQKY